MNVVIFSGIQATGKSTFFKERFADTHIRINLDMLRTRNREKRLFELCLELQQPCVVDNTNPAAADRASYIEPARAAGFSIDPVKQAATTATRRRLKVDHELPMRDEFSEFVSRLLVNERGQ